MKKLLLCLVIAGISLFTGCGDKEADAKKNEEKRQQKKVEKQNVREGTDFTTKED